MHIEDGGGERQEARPRLTGITDIPDDVAVHPAFARGWNAHVRPGGTEEAIVEAIARNPDENPFSVSPMVEYLLLAKTNELLGVPVPTKEEYFSTKGITDTHDPALFDGRLWERDEHGDLVRRSVTVEEIEQEQARWREIKAGRGPLRLFLDGITDLDEDETSHLRVVEGVGSQESAGQRVARVMTAIGTNLINTLPGRRRGREY